MAIIRTTNGHNYKVSKEALAAALKEEEKWAGKLREALVGGAAYDEKKHRELAEEIELIEAKLGNYSGTIFDHVRSIFDDTVTRGFQHELHFPQLIAQYTRYGFGNPPEQWVPPPDVQSRDNTPELLPAAPAPRPATRSSQQPAGRRIPPVGNTTQLALGVTISKEDQPTRPAARGENSPAATRKPNDNKGETQQDVNGEQTAVGNAAHKRTMRATPMTGPATLEGDVGDDDEEGLNKRKTTRGDSRKPQMSRSVAGDATDGSLADDSHSHWPKGVRPGSTKYTPGCGRCERTLRECWAFNKNNTKATCFECRKGKIKCDMNGQVFDDEEHNDDEEKEELPLAKKKKQTRRKLEETVEYAGKWGSVLTSSRN
jgi:hypothetical protein